MKKRNLFNDGWKFTKQKINTKLALINDENLNWVDIDVPHDWLIYDTKNLYETSDGWYKKRFVLGDLGDKKYFLYFEGVYMDSTVFVNNIKAGEWKYGYSSFEFDITEFLKTGENEIKVRVVHQAPNSRWYSGAGIYRNVWFKVTNPIHLATDGIYISTKKEKNDWYVNIQTEILNETENVADIILKHTIYDKAGVSVISSQKNLAPGADLVINKERLFIKEPALWEPGSPYLYSLKTEIIKDGVIIDEETKKFGFRELHFDCNKGFFINGKYLKLHGACQHHDLGALGAAVNKVALRRQLTILMEMGVNAIRTSHNMPAVELMELADEMGILILSEAFDMWERPKTKYDYARFFNDWFEKDVASWIRRDRNHPSIIMWSIGNEIYDTYIDLRGLEITKRLRDLVLMHDPEQNGIITIGSNYMFGEKAQRCADELQAAGYNYAEYLYEDHHRKYPDWVIYGSETASTLQSRGVYHFPASEIVLTHDDKQCSALGNCSTTWGAKSTERTIIDDRNAKFCLGQFIWTGFDYIGEPTPYTTKNSYFGQIDTAGFKKDSFYLYQAEWTDYKEKPMVHILPYWDFNEGQLIDIRVYSNAPKIELFFNEESMGQFDIDHENGEKLYGEWQLPYQKGTIQAVAYDENDDIIAVDTRTSFSDPEKIVLKPDKLEINADGQDLIFVEILAVDKNNNPVENARNRVSVEVSGAGRLVGLDNGDSTDYDQYKGTSRRLFSGKLLAIVAAKLEPGDIKVRVSSTGLKPAELKLKALPAVVTPGVSAIMENKKSTAIEEIPVRKIQLRNNSSNHLTEEDKTAVVTAEILPGVASYHDLEWKVVTSKGIETNIASVEVSDDGMEAKVTAIADGSFRLCCLSKNGRNIAEVISELEFDITGLGEIVLNPYEFISAGLYNAGNGEFSNAAEGGIVTYDNERSYIGFSDLDFGDYGSDEITIQIFHRNSEPLPLEIWGNMPGEDNAELLASVKYQAEPIWYTYQPNTFKLSRKVKGITTLYLVTDTRTELKGFQFTYYEKAYASLKATENTCIYGDSFTIKDEMVEDIGNNVVIEFENMNFSRGLSKLIICGRSHNEINTLQIRFSDEYGEITQSVEFPFSKEYIEREFEMDSINGLYKVSFVFLPGSSFDFKWFRFMREYI